MFRPYGPRRKKPIYRHGRGYIGYTMFYTPENNFDIDFVNKILYYEEYWKNPEGFIGANKILEYNFKLNQSKIKRMIETIDKQYLTVSNIYNA